jgi:hypothetical protein
MGAERPARSSRMRRLCLRRGFMVEAGILNWSAGVTSPNMGRKALLDRLIANGSLAHLCGECRLHGCF